MSVEKYKVVRWDGSCWAHRWGTAIRRGAGRTFFEENTHHSPPSWIIGPPIFHCFVCPAAAKAAGFCPHHSVIRNNWDLYALKTLWSKINWKRGSRAVHRKRPYFFFLILSSCFFFLILKFLFFRCEHLPLSRKELLEDPCRAYRFVFVRSVKEKNVLIFCESIVCNFFFWISPFFVFCTWEKFFR